MRLHLTAPTERATGVALPAARLRLLGLGTLAYLAAAWLQILSDHGDSAPVAVTAFGLFVLGTGLLLAAVLRHEREQVPATGSLTRAGRIALLTPLALGTVVTLALTFGFLRNAGVAGTLYDSDAAAFNHFNAELVLHGRNPYTANDTFWLALRQFPYVGATPLRLGRYAGSTLGPSLTQLVADVKSELANPSQRGPEFAPASLHSYPALAFLVYVPGIWAGLPTTLLTSLLFVSVFLLAAAWDAPRGMRLTLWLILLANSPLVFWTLRGSFEVIALLPAMLAWRWLDRRVASPVLLGLACAVKQIIWPLLPFYAILTWRRAGPRETLRRLALAGLAFLAPNAPFLVQAPGAWARSMLLPVSLPMFPSGVGLVELSRAGVLPLWPTRVYTVLELLALVALLAWFARLRHAPPEVALILGLLPFALSYHSAFAYFIAIPALAVFAVLSRVRAPSRPAAAQPQHALDLSVAAATP
jgi:hypothetical protein